MKWRRKKDRQESILLDQQQAETLTELGNQLRQSRQEQGLSLDKVAATTLIQRRLLQAIEAGQLDELPEPIYIQNLIKRYADVLSLNGEELSSSFPTGYTRLSLKPSWRRLPAAQLRPIHLYLLYILIIICSVNSLSHILSRSGPQASSDHQNKQQLKAERERKLVLPKRSNLESVSTTPGATAKTSKLVRIEVALKAPSWIRVVADGKTQFEGLLPEGTQRTWIAQDQLTVRAGNAGGVLITFNQEKAKQLGSPGEVQEVTFAANSSNSRSQ